jgi:DNA polymerase-3 subunit alpha
LIKSGACDCLGQNRATLFSLIERTLSRAATIISDRQRGQSSLFGALESQTPEPVQAVKLLDEWPEHDMLAHEKELLGFYVTGHPLTPYAPLLEKFTLTNLRAMAELPNRSLTRVGGMVAAVQNGFSKKSGKPYCLATVEDLEGSVQVLCMNENYDKYRELLAPGKALLLIGEVVTGEEKPKLFPQEIMLLEDAPRKFTKQVHLRLHTSHFTPARLDSVLELVAAHPGKCPLFLCFMRPSGEIIFVEAHERYFVAPSRRLQDAADELFGADTYYAKVDSSLPERQLRRWERKPDGDNGE